MSTDREKQAGANTAGQSALIETLGAEPNYCDDCQQDGTCVACSCCPNEDDDSACKWFSEDFARP